MTHAQSHSPSSLPHLGQGSSKGHYCIANEKTHRPFSRLLGLCIVLACGLLPSPKPVRALPTPHAVTVARDGAMSCVPRPCVTSPIGGKAPPTITGNGVWDLLALRDPITGDRLVDELYGTTRQADRVARAIESGDIWVRVLDDERFDRRYRNNGGRNVAGAYAYGRVIVLKKSSPTLLGDVVHEGTHALDYLSDPSLSRRQLELRAYFYERQFCRATGTPTQFASMVDLVAFVYSRY